MRLSSLNLNAYSYGYVETDSVSKQILISESNSIPEPIPQSTPEPIPEPIPELIPITESIPETSLGPTIRNRFQKTAELVGIDSDENFIFPITTMDAFFVVVPKKKSII